MVAGICVQDKYQLVDVCAGRIAGNTDCIVYSKLPGNKSGDCEPGEVITNRVSNDGTRDMIRDKEFKNRMIGLFEVFGFVLCEYFIEL